MRDRKLLIVAGLAAGLFVATACSSSSSSTGVAGGTTSTSSTSSSADTADVTGQGTFEVDQQDFFFAPSTIDGSAGQKITFTVKNAGTTAHTFTIDNMNIDVTVAPGDETAVDVTFPASGSVEFYCKFHASRGMTGTLEVA